MRCFPEAHEATQDIMQKEPPPVGEGSFAISCVSIDYCLKITIRFQSLCEGYS